MKTVRIKENQSAQYLADRGNTTYVVETGVSIISPDAYGIHAYADVEDRNIVVKGYVSASAGTGIRVGGPAWTGEGRLVVRDTGWVLGQTGVDLSASGQLLRNAGTIEGVIGVEMTAPRTTVVNTGLIDATDDGIYAAFGSGTIRNSGTILGTDSGVYTQTGNGQFLQIVNDGIIHGDERALRLSPAATGTIEIINRGEISSPFWSIVSNTGTGIEIIRNSGTITGNISLGGGNDIYDGRGGYASIVRGEEGNDLYIIDDPLINLTEVSSGGLDTVRSLVNWTLNTFFENLELIGHDHTTGKGNGEANRLAGNSGNNMLFGQGGADVLEGGRGEDVLNGGSEGDVFVFRKGSGRDTIADFQNGLDYIDITGLSGIDDFSQVEAKMQQKGADVVISFSRDDALRIENTVVGTLGADDFAY